MEPTSFALGLVFGFIIGAGGIMTLAHYTAPKDEELDAMKERVNGQCDELEEMLAARRKETK